MRLNVVCQQYRRAIMPNSIPMDKATYSSMHSPFRSQFLIPNAISPYAPPRPLLLRF